MPTEPPDLDPSSIGTRLLLVFALIFANALFVAFEFALVSVRRTRIDQLAAEGNGSAVLVQRALKDIKKYLAAVQVGVTLASLMLGSMGEQALSPVFDTLLAPLVPAPIVGVTRLTIAVFIAYFIMTILTVILGELMPKAVTLQKSEMVALLLVRPMILFVKITAPFVWLLNGIGGFLLSRLGLTNSEEASVHSAEELDFLFAQSHEGGELTETERDILHRVVRFSDLTAREVMVPRVEMKALPREMTRGELFEIVYDHPHTRMPLYDGSIDDIVGMVHLKDLVRFTRSLQNESSTHNDIVNLMPLTREIPRVPETLSIDKILVEFKRRHQQMAIVIDEYGGTSGLLTMGDLLEQAFGDVADEFDSGEPEIFERTDGRVQMPGKTLIVEINDLYATGFSDEESDTMAGLILGALGRPAQVGDEVDINQHHLRVESVDRLRITVLSMSLPREAPTVAT